MAPARNDPARPGNRIPVQGARGGIRRTIADVRLARLAPWLSAPSSSGGFPMTTIDRSPGVSDEGMRAAGRNGALAALAVLFLDLLWRATAAPTGVNSIPETVVAAVARLTPTAIFGWATETFGSLAQNTLFAAVLLGIVGAGAWAGRIAGVGSASRRFGAGTAGRRRAPAGSRVAPAGERPAAGRARDRSRRWPPRRALCAGARAAPGGRSSWRG